MAVNTTTPSNQPYAFFATQGTEKNSAKPHTQGTARQLRTQNGMTDTFQAEATQRPLMILPLLPQELLQLSRNPLRQAQLLQRLSQSPSKDAQGRLLETPQARLAMFHRLSQQLPPNQHDALDALLTSPKNPLLQTDGDNPHSTLYYLYAMAFAPKAQGWHAPSLVQDAVQILSHPQDIEQDNTPLEAPYKQALLAVSNHPSGDKHNAQVLPSARTEADLNVIRTFNCSEASEMSRMASLHPKELIRHLVELTSPVESFYEKATPQELSPDDPSQVYAELAKRNMAYQKTADGNLLVEVPASRAAVLRAQNTQAKLLRGKALGPKEASPLQVLYQETLLYNGGRKSYDVATDKRDMLDIAQTGVWSSTALSDEEKAVLCQRLQIPQADEARKSFTQAFQPFKSKIPPQEAQGILDAVWGENSGLTGDEKLFNERLINDGKAYKLLQYQALDVPPDPKDPNYGDLYLYGYYRNFKDTENDLVTALTQGEEPILNESIALKNGYTVPGHEVKLQASDLDPKTGERRFYLVNTDDDAKGLEQVYAKDFIPKVGHVSLPQSLSDPIQQAMNQVPGILVPDATDAKAYRLQPTVALPPAASA
ncbi:MAG: hypothetical protein HEQ32_08120 [Vampirovibrio sp.]